MRHVHCGPGQQQGSPALQEGRIPAHDEQGTMLAFCSNMEKRVNGGFQSPNERQWIAGIRPTLINCWQKLFGISLPKDIASSSPPGNKARALHRSESAREQNRVRRDQENVAARRPCDIKKVQGKQCVIRN
jgi:hypothetical protein